MARWPSSIASTLRDEYVQSKKVQTLSNMSPLLPQLHFHNCHCHYCFLIQLLTHQKGSIMKSLFSFLWCFSCGLSFPVSCCKLLLWLSYSVTSSILAWAALLAIEKPLSLNLGSRIVPRTHNDSYSMSPYLSWMDFNIPLIMDMMLWSSTSSENFYLKILTIGMITDTLGYSPLTSWIASSNTFSSLITI